jgi:hypothetical protein
MQTGDSSFVFVLGNFIRLEYFLNRFDDGFKSLKIKDLIRSSDFGDSLKRIENDKQCNSQK